MSVTADSQRPILKDGMGRTIVNLRISVTDRCNFRCTYCMPADNVEFMDRQKLLTFEELTRLVGVVSRMGIYRLRLTGGEPMLRKDLPDLVRMLHEVQGIEDIAMTTNAFFLKNHAKALRDAGLNRLNISLDALDKEKFAHVNRRDCVQEVLDGIATAQGNKVRPTHRVMTSTSFATLRKLKIINEKGLHARLRRAHPEAVVDPACYAGRIRVGSEIYEASLTPVILALLGLVVAAQ